MSQKERLVEWLVGGVHSLEKLKDLWEKEGFVWTEKEEELSSLFLNALKSKKKIVPREDFDFKKSCHLKIEGLVDFYKKQREALDWQPFGGTYNDITSFRAENIVVTRINREEKRNAFRPQTIEELRDVFYLVEKDSSIRSLILAGQGEKAFCSGGDQSIRGDSGYKDDKGDESLNVLALQRQMRSLPIPVIAMVSGYAIGGGHVLHMLSDLTIAAENAIFGQTGPRVGSFDGGFGASYMARLVGHKRAREIWFLCCQYSAEEALDMGLINRVVPLGKLEEETYSWALRIQDLSPTAIRCLKYSLNADSDGIVGLQQLAGEATALFYQSDEGQEGRDAFVQKRAPQF